MECRFYTHQASPQLIPDKEIRRLVMVELFIIFLGIVLMDVYHLFEKIAFIQKPQSYSE